MTRKFPLYAFIALIASVFTIACSSSNDEKQYDSLINPALNAVVVDSFRLVRNDSILVGLDSVFFSIDLDRAIVYNADSLPKGTKVDALQIGMSVGDASKAEITMPDSHGNDTVVNYLEDTYANINFSRGYVKLALESYNKEYKRDYTIYVNVHKMDPDTIVWGELTSTSLPSTFTDIDAQRTVEHQGKALCFTQSAENFCLMVAENPSEKWEEQNINLPSDARIETITSGTTKLYILDINDNLYETADMGQSWTAVDAKMNHIYGCIEDLVVGARNDNGTYMHVTYPATTESKLPKGCPIEGTSQSLVYTTDWSEKPTMIIIGGIDADGYAVSGTWGYDGTTWQKTSISGLPALESPMLIPYYAIKAKTFWRATKASVLLAFGGRAADRIDNPVVYVSYDFGVHWSKAPSKLQFPSTLIPGAYAQALVFESELGSRASKPITQWECPYVYIFGGIDSEDNLSTAVYRGAINRLTFKPLQ